MIAPGRLLHRLAALICSTHTLEHIVEPAIADLQNEYAGACGIAERIRILVAGDVAILKVIAICAVRTPMGDEEQCAVLRALAWAAAMTFGVAVILIALQIYTLYEPLGGWYAATILVPQALPLAIPIGLAFAIALCFSSRPTVSSAKVMLFAAVSASALSFCILAWAMPAGNRAYKDLTIRELRGSGYQGTITQPWRAHNEMTLSELRGQIAKFSAKGEPQRTRHFAFRFHLRFALAAATLALVCALLAAPVNHHGWRGVLAFGVCCAYWMLMFAGDWGSRRGYVPPPLGAWLSNLALVLFAMVIAFVPSRSSRLRGPRDHGPA